MMGWSFFAGLALIGASLALDALFARRFAGGDGSGDEASCRWLVVSLTSNMTLAIALSLAGVGAYPWPPELLGPLGVSVGAAGLALRYAAVVTLGRYFTWRVTVFDDHALIRHGVFRWLRHPSYTGGLLAAAGILLALGNGLALLIFACTHVPLVLHRVRLEEQTLLAHFGDAYRAYMAETPALVPFFPAQPRKEAP